MSRAEKRNTKSRAIQKQAHADQKKEAATRWTRRRQREFSQTCAAEHRKRPDLTTTKGKAEFEAFLQARGKS